jgi:hypothetical protein
MSLLNLVWCVALFWVLVFGLGLPLTVGLPLRSDEKVGLAPGAALIVIYLAAFAIYSFNVPTWCFGLLPVAALAGLGWRSREVLVVFRDPDARRLLGAYVVWTGWGLGFLALVRCYFGIGAGATGDWVEHFQRTCFFLGHWPLDYRFIWLYPLAARPPLANLATGAFLVLSRETFPFFQVFSALQSMLVLLPGWLLCRRLGGGRTAAYVFLLLCMLNPLLMHNATYPWTKLITAYFVLAGLHLFLLGRDRGSTGFFRAGFLFLSAGLLAHYSAGPYLLVLALLYLFAHRSRWLTRSFLGATSRVVLPSALLLSTWFGWSWTHYGPAATALSNTAVTSTGGSPLSRLIVEKLGNLVTSLLPLPLRDPSYSAPIQILSPPAALDQHLYLFYQLTLPFAFGCAGLVFLLWLLGQKCVAGAHRGPAPDRGFWIAFLAGTAVIGLLVNGQFDRYGLAHICLQPLVVLGLAFLAAELPHVSRSLRRVFGAGLALDFLLGVVLHFHVEHAELSLVGRETAAFRAAAPAPVGLPPLWTDGVFSNLLAKFYFGLTFVGDGGLSPWLAAAFLAGLLVLVVRWQVRAAAIAPGDPSASSPPPAP